MTLTVICEIHYIGIIYAGMRVKHIQSNRLKFFDGSKHRQIPEGFATNSQDELKSACSPVIYETPDSVQYFFPVVIIVYSLS